MNRTKTPLGPDGRNHSPSRCRHCKAVIRWTKMIDTKVSMALEREPDPIYGTVQIVREGMHGVYHSVEIERQAALARGVELHRPHH